MKNDIYHSAYFAAILNPTKLKKVVKQLSDNIKEFQKTHRVDAIAIRGMSGALIGGIISNKLGIPLMCVRKGKSHSDFKVETYLTEYKPQINYIIIDDLICSGRTITAIIQEVKKEFKNINEENVKDDVKSMKPVPVGIFLYNDSPESFTRWMVGRKTIPVKAFRVKTN